VKIYAKAKTKTFAIGYVYTVNIC